MNQSDGVRLGRVLLDVAARDELGDIFARTDEEGRAFVQRRGRLREDVVHAVRGGGTRSDNKFPSMGGRYDKFRELLDDSEGPNSWVEFWEEIK